MIEHHGNFLPIDTPLSFRRHLFVIYLSKSAAPRNGVDGLAVERRLPNRDLAIAHDSDFDAEAALGGRFRRPPLRHRYVTSCGGRVKKIVIDVHETTKGNRQ
jgi:hypothetical protein